MSGGGGFKKMFFNQLIHKPVQTYLVGGLTLYMLREYQTRSTFNYWFGKNEFERRVAKGLIWSQKEKEAGRMIFKRKAFLMGSAVIYQSTNK